MLHLLKKKVKINWQKCFDFEQKLRDIGPEYRFNPDTLSEVGQ